MPVLPPSFQVAPAPLFQLVAVAELQLQAMQAAGLRSQVAGWWWWPAEVCEWLWAWRSVSNCSYWEGLLRW